MNPVYAGGCQVPSFVSFTQSQQMAFKDGFLYIPTGSKGTELTVVDATDPASPTVVTTLADDCVQPRVDGDLLFALNQDTLQGAVNVLDIADPQSVHLEGKMLTYHDWVGGGSSTTQCLAASDRSLSKRYLFAGVALTDPGMAFYHVFFTEIFDATQPLSLEPPSSASVVGGIEPATAVPNKFATSLCFANSALFMGYEGNGLWASHIGPDGYSYILDQSSGTVPNTTPDGGKSGLGADLTVTAPADGTYYFHVRAVDNAGTWSPTVTRKVQIDSGGPTVTTNADGLPHRVFTLFLTADDGSGSGVAKTEYRVDGGAWKAGTSVTLKCFGKRRTYSVGTHTVEYRATDVAGNVGSVGSCQVKLAP